MSRQIHVEPALSTEGEPAFEAKAGARPGRQKRVPEDDYRDRLIKLIPSEVVALYLFLTGVVAGANPKTIPQGQTMTAIFLAMLALTPPYLIRVAGVSSRVQVGVSTVAFVVWAFSIGGPFPYLMKQIGVSYQPIYGTIVLAIYTFAVPIFTTPYRARKK